MIYLTTVIVGTIRIDVSVMWSQVDNYSEITNILWLPSSTSFFGLGEDLSRNSVAAYIYHNNLAIGEFVYTVNTNGHISSNVECYLDYYQIIEQ